jgi:TonB-linked SusC/RagA family outer membrane protein
MIKYITIVTLLLFSVILLPRMAAGQAANIQVQGIVTNRGTDEPMSGVTVLLGGSKQRGLGRTSEKGAYKVSVPVNSKLIFRYVGFVDQEVQVTKEETALNIRLEEKSDALGEVVIRGYKSTSRATDPGSSTVISGKDLQDVPVSNVEVLLQGKVAGLNIQVNTGAPGYRGSVLLRGLSNIDVVAGSSDEEAYLTPTSPLYVIDGIPVDADAPSESGYQTPGPGVSPLSLIPPEDIMSIEVLKDAQATSLYGSRGAFGVIIITTRQGNSEIPRIRYSGNFFVSTPPQLRATLGGKAERDFKINQIYKYGTWDDITNRLPAATFLSDSLSAYYNNSTDWQKVFYGTTYNQKHNLAIEGGQREFNYKANLGYYNEKGIVANTGFQSYTVNMNMTYRPNAKFSIFSILKGSLGKKSKGSGVGLLQSGVARNTSASSLLPPPSLFTSTTDILNALEVKNDNSSKNMQASFKADYNISKGLNMGSTVSYDLSLGSEDNFTPAAAFNQFAKAFAYNDSKYTVYNRNNISYSGNIRNVHEYSVSAFNELYLRGGQAYAAEQRQLPSDQYIGPIGYNGDFGQSTGGGLLRYNKSRAVSFAGSFSYNYLRKYVVSLTYRVDASSFSGNENPYSRNPSIGLKWNIEKENLVKKIKWIDYASLRGTWGKSIAPTGNVFAVYGTYEPNGFYNGLQRIGIKYDAIPNPNLGSATSTSYNVGFDGSVRGGAVNFSFDIYYRKMERQVKNLNLPDVLGFNYVASNEVALVNYGYEGKINFRLLPKSSKVSWTMAVTGALSKDVLISLPGGVNQIVFGSTVFHVGRNSLSNYLYKTLGVFATDAEVPVNPKTGLRLRNSSNSNAFFQAGDPHFEDVDGDYVITDKDRQVLGNSQPLMFGGLSTSLAYKSFGLMIAGSYTYDRDIINVALAERLKMAGNPFGTQAVLPLDDINYWKNVGQRAIYPDALNYTRAGNIDPFRYNQSLFQEDGSYFKINTVVFTYAFNKQQLRRLGINGLRVSATAYNVAIFSPYSGPNAENVTDLGFDDSKGYPVPRTYSVGINVDL